MNQRRRIPGKVMICLALLLLAVVRASSGSFPERWLCVAAVCLYITGDGMLMYPKWVRRRLGQPLLLAMVTFGLGHLVMIGAYLLRSGGGISGLRPGADIAAVIWIVSLFLLIIQGVEDFKQLIAMAIYGILTCSLCAVTITCARSAGVWLCAWGGLSFHLSDLCLGLNRMRGSELLQQLVWILYPAGVILLVLGL